MQSNAMKSMLLYQIAQLPRLKDKGLCREYMLGREYAEHRIGRIVGRKSSSVLQFLLDHLTEDERTRMFPGDFDLGNMNSSSPATIGALKNELEPDENCRTTGPENFFRDACKKVPVLTGHALGDYMEQDARKTLKVLKLLYQMNAASPVQLFAFLTPPGDDNAASFEVATTYPVKDEKAIAGTALLADLITQLAVELPVERREEIEDLYITLREKVDKIENALFSAASQRSGGDFARLEKMLALVRDMLARQATTDDIEAKPAFVPLDEQLCLHCNGLEFLNYAQAQRELTEKMTPTVKVKPPTGKLAVLNGAVRACTGDSARYPKLPLSMFVAFAHANAETLITILSDYLGHEIRAVHYVKAIPLALNLLEIWVAFGRADGLRALASDAPLQPTSMLAALAAVCHQLSHPARYRPYWQGQPNDRGNVITALEKIDIRNAKTRVPEGLMRFWDHHLKWHAHALYGQLSIYEHKLAITQYLVAALEHPVRCHNTDLLRRRLDDHVKLAAQAANILDRGVD
jgi:hypothetical protein